MQVDNLRSPPSLASDGGSGGRCAASECLDPCFDHIPRTAREINGGKWIDRIQNLVGNFLVKDAINVKTFGQRNILICFGLDPSTWIWFGKVDI